MALRIVREGSLRGYKAAHSTEHDCLECNSGKLRDFWSTSFNVLCFKKIIETFQYYNKMLLTSLFRVSVKELSRKWKNLRQCCKRERESQIKSSGSATRRKTKYLYSDILSLLKPMFSTEPTDFSNSDVEDGEEHGGNEETL